jgi:hypothetical protein
MPRASHARFNARPIPASGWAPTEAVIPLATGCDAYFIPLAVGTIGSMTTSGPYAPELKAA